MELAFWGRETENEQRNTELKVILKRLWRKLKRMGRKRVMSSSRRWGFKGVLTWGINRVDIFKKNFPGRGDSMCEGLDGNIFGPIWRCSWMNMKPNVWRSGWSWAGAKPCGFNSCCPKSPRTPEPGYICREGELGVQLPPQLTLPAFSFAYIEFCGLPAFPTQNSVSKQWSGHGEERGAF